MTRMVKHFDNFGRPEKQHVKQFKEKIYFKNCKTQGGKRHE